MPVWLLKTFHVLGLTNLSDKQVEEYAGFKTPKISFSSRPISEAAGRIKITDNPKNPIHLTTGS